MLHDEDLAHATSTGFWSAVACLRSMAIGADQAFSEFENASELENVHGEAALKACAATTP